MNLFRKLRHWCPQPQNPVAINANKISAPIIAFVVIAEIMLLLVAPLAYLGLIVPKPEINLGQGTYTLTERQIEAAWPNLPTAQQIVNSGVYAFYNTNDYIIGSNSTANKIYLQTPPHWWDNSSVTIVLQNETQTNLPATMGDYPHGLIPVVYQIYLQLNSTMWIQVPQTYLANTSHPPLGLSETDSGVLGTGLSITYAVIAITVIVVTLLAGTAYALHRKKQVTKIEGA